MLVCELKCMEKAVLVVTFARMKWNRVTVLKFSRTCAVYGSYLISRNDSIDSTDVIDAITAIR